LPLLIQLPSSGKGPAATPEIGIAEKTTPGVADVGRCLGMRRNAMICDIGTGHRPNGDPEGGKDERTDE
jgi:hypothetical protein